MGPRSPAALFAPSSERRLHLRFVRARPSVLSRARAVRPPAEEHARHTDAPTVKISDFGISHELRGMTAVRPNVVHHAIMAPEILATGYTSRQSDLYQVGLLLYWMLAGEPAIQMDVPYQELVRQVADGAPRLRAEQLGTPFGDLI